MIRKPLTTKYLEKKKQDAEDLHDGWKEMRTHLFGTDFITKVKSKGQNSQGQEGKTCLRRRCWERKKGELG